MNQQLPLDIGFPREHTLEDYVPGPNAEALAAVRSCALGDGEPYVYLWGSPGTGKSHLLLGACRALDAAGGSALYLDLNLSAGLDMQILEGLERLDLVALDDVHEIAGDAHWERGLFNLYNRLRDNGSRLLASADAPAAELSIRLADLHSRLEWGPGFRLRPLDDAARLQLLRNSASARGMQLPRDTALYILYHCPRDPYSLEALLDRIDHASLAQKRRPTVPFVRSILSDSED